MFIITFLLQAVEFLIATECLQLFTRNLQCHFKPCHTHMRLCVYKK